MLLHFKYGYNAFPAIGTSHFTGLREIILCKKANAVQCKNLNRQSENASHFHVQLHSKYFFNLHIFRPDSFCNHCHSCISGFQWYIAEVAGCRHFTFPNPCIPPTGSNLRRGNSRFEKAVLFLQKLVFLR